MNIVFAQIASTLVGGNAPVRKNAATPPRRKLHARLRATQYRPYRSGGFALGFATLLALLFNVAIVNAQEAAWPNRVVKIVVVFVPGGASDLVGRLISPRLSAALGQQFIVENRPGAGGMIGTDFVAKAPPDGYTLILSNVSSHSLAPLLNRNTKYDPMRDFTHIALLGSSPHVLLVHPGSRAKSLAEFVALVKAQPGKLNYGTGGNGTINHVAGELLKSTLGLDITHVPYKGNAAAIVDLRGLRIEAAIDALPQNVGAIRSGDLRALAIMSGERSAMAPDVPTLVELGHPNVRVENWIGLSGPADMPGDIVNRLAVELEKVLQLPDTRQRLAEWGISVVFRRQAAFADYVRDDIARWRPVITAAGVRVE